jgi:hypothetical protein
MKDENKTPTWQKIVAGILVVIVAFALIFGWSRIGPDAWPPDRSFVGPNLVAAIVQWMIIFVVGVLVWPPTRRRMHRFVDRKIAPLHVKLDAHETMHQEHADKLDRLAQRLEDLHAKHDKRA